MDKTARTRRVLGYARVSTTEQVVEGISLDAQRHRIRAYCDAHGLALVGIEADEGLSAKRTSNRPALQRALEALKKKEAAGLVAVKLDRLSRTTRDVLDLVARSDREAWELHSIDERLDTGTAQGRFVVTILGGLAQLEREQTAERTRQAMAELRRQRRRISGKPPFGYRFEGDAVVAEPAEQPVLERMLALRDAGHGEWKIARVLNDEGLGNPRTGNDWFYGTVRAILRNARA